MRADAAAGGYPPPLVTYRHAVLLDNEQKASEAAVQLLVKMESWELLLPGSLLFRRAISCAQFDLLDSQHQYFRHTVRLLPLELGPEHGNVVTDPIASPSDLEKLCNARDRYVNDMHQLSGWLHDISVEAQLALLGGLFEGPLARRVLVLDSRREEELLHYFDNDTAQARSHAETIRDVTEALAGASKTRPQK